MTLKITKKSDASNKHKTYWKLGMQDPTKVAMGSMSQVS